jgi:hypothetical protein
MESYLWVEAECGGVLNSFQYVQKYFILNPFLGILFLNTKPDTATDGNSIYECHPDLGWLVGGSLVPLEVSSGAPIPFQHSSSPFLFPLLLSVKSNDNNSTSRNSAEHVENDNIKVETLFCENELERDRWIDAINSLMFNLEQISTFVEHGSLPFPSLISVVRKFHETNCVELSSLGDSPGCEFPQVTTRFLAMIRQYSKKRSVPGSVSERVGSGIIQRIKFVNAHLSDKHLSYLNSIILLNSSFLLELDLSSNLLTSNGVKALCQQSLFKCSFLESLNLSSNYISDSSSSVLSDCLVKLKRLKTFSISRNRLTKEAAKFFSVGLGNHNSKLQVLDFSFNELSDEVGMLTAFLLRNVPSQLSSIDLSFCGLSDVSLYEIAKSLSCCLSLRYLSLQGNRFHNHDISRYLIRAVSDLHVKQAASATRHDLDPSFSTERLILQFAGIVWNDQIVSPAVSSLSVLSRCLKSSFLELSEPTNLQEVCLRKFTNNTSSSSSVCCLRLEPCDWLTDCRSVVFLLSNEFGGLLTPFPLPLFRVRSVSSSQSGALFIFLSSSLNSSSSTMNKFLASIKFSHALFRLLNIKSVCVDSSSSGMAEQLKSEVGTVLLNSIIKRSGYGGNGLSDYFLPLIAPTSVFRVTEGAVEYIPSTDVNDGEVDTDEETKVLQNVTLSLDASFWTSDLEDDLATEIIGRDGCVKGKDSAFDSAGDLEEGGMLFVEGREFTLNMIEFEKNLREKRLINERLMLAVRRLYATKEVSRGVAQFWEGMFGNKKYKSFAEKQLVSSMLWGHERLGDPSIFELGLSHIFPAVAIREQLYQAMYGRDIEEMERIIGVLSVKSKSHVSSAVPSSFGGYALIYCQRLFNEIIALKQQFQNVKLLLASSSSTSSSSYSELPLIEDFLFACGKVSYTGEEMFEAVELRQRLYHNGMKTGGASFTKSSKSIQLKAVVTNLLISRDFSGLSNVINEWKQSTGDFSNNHTSSTSGSSASAVFPSELKFAEDMVNDYMQAMNNLRSAVEKKDIELLDYSLSVSSYYNFYSSSSSKLIEECLSVLNDLSRNPATLMRPIVEGLRRGKMAEVDKGFENLLKMGLCHEALDAVVCSKIHAIRARIIQV